MPDGLVEALAERCTLHSAPEGGRSGPQAAGRHKAYYCSINVCVCVCVCVCETSTDGFTFRYTDCNTRIKMNELQDKYLAMMGL